MNEPEQQKPVNPELLKLLLNLEHIVLELTLNLPQQIQVPSH